MHSDVTGIQPNKVIKTTCHWFDVTGFFSKKTAHLQFDTTYSTQQSQHKACHDSTLRVFSVKTTHWFDVTGFFSKKNSFAIWHYIFNTTKSTKRLSRFDVTGFFSKKTAHLQSDITYSTQQSQHKACHDSTLRVFSVKRHSFAFWRYGFFQPNKEHQFACHDSTLHMSTQQTAQHAKLASHIRRYKVFSVKKQLIDSTLRVFSVKRTHLQSDITYSTQQSQPNACHDSTLLGLFSKKNSFAIWHYIFNTTKSTKRLSRFDVTGFFSKKTAHLQSDITYSTQQSQQNACHDSTLRVFSVKRHSFAIWHYIFNTTKST